MQKKGMKWVIGSLLLCGFALTDGFACTSVVVSGKVTPDGRSLLWKHRDTDYEQNNVAWFKGEKYNFIGIVNSVEAHPTDVWIGTNEAGFSLMNTQPFNLVDVKDGDERGPANGRALRRALELCATVEDFCHFLDTISKPSMIEANFGVTDAEGGAAMFEVDYERYTMFDANNPKDAPCGYIARTNFSFVGKVNEGLGHVRYMLEEQKLLPASASGQITPQWIFNELSRSFVNPLLGIDLKRGDFNSPKTTGWFNDQDFIPRRGSASSVVIQGVKKGENPELTTMWTILGYPPVGVAVPVWLKGADRKLPAVLRKEESLQASVLGHRTFELTKQVYSYHQGIGSARYFHWDLLYNLSGTGIMQRLAPVEAEVFHRTLPCLQAWRKKDKIDMQETFRLYDELDSYVLSQYQQLFGL